MGLGQGYWREVTLTCTAMGNHRDVMPTAKLGFDLILPFATAYTGGWGTPRACAGAGRSLACTARRRRGECGDAGAPEPRRTASLLRRHRYPSASSCSTDTAVQVPVRARARELVLVLARVPVREPALVPLLPLALAAVRRLGRAVVGRRGRIVARSIDLRCCGCRH